MKETYTAQDTASSASLSHEKRDSYCANPPAVLQDLPEDDDEPPIRPPFKGPEFEKEQQHHGNAQKYPIAQITTASSISDGITIQKRPFDRDAGELAKNLHSSLSSGLDDSEVQNRLK